jgi:dipeptidyl aminopeptidase/acylaminoacyl peptidase
MPRWSADGRQIAYFWRAPDGRWKISVVAAEGGRTRQVTRGDRSELDPDWPPDGNRLVFGGLVDEHTPERPIQIGIVDLESGVVSSVPGSEGLFSPRWSPDGGSIAALSLDFRRLLLYELATRRWRELMTGTDQLGYPNWTRDGTQIQLLKGSEIVRVRAADGHVAPVTSLDGVTRVGRDISEWLGLAPDDSPLVLRQITPAPEIYALDVEWP